VKEIRLWKLHILCPVWRYHVRWTWMFQPFTQHWFCRWCPLAKFNGIGMAWRRTIGKERTT